MLLGWRAFTSTTVVALMGALWTLSLLACSWFVLSLSRRYAKTMVLYLKIRRSRRAMFPTVRMLGWRLIVRLRSSLLLPNIRQMLCPIPISALKVNLLVSLLRKSRKCILWYSIGPGVILARSLPTLSRTRKVRSALNRSYSRSIPRLIACRCSLVLNIVLRLEVWTSDLCSSLIGLLLSEAVVVKVRVETEKMLASTCESRNLDIRLVNSSLRSVRLPLADRRDDKRLEVIKCVATCDVHPTYRYKGITGVTCCAAELSGHSTEARERR